MLAKSGYFGGNPQTVLTTPVDIVLQTYQYEMFTREYEETYYEINKREWAESATRLMRTNKKENK